MSPHLFKQRRLLSWREYELRDDGVAVTERSPTSSSTFLVRFEDISAEPFEVQTSSSFRLWATVILGTLTLVLVVLAWLDSDVGWDAPAFWGAFFALAGGSWLVSRKRYLIFPAGDPALVLLENRPSAEAVADFVEAMQASKLRYLTDRYLGGRGELTPAETLRRLEWLRERRVLSGEQCDLLSGGLGDTDPQDPAAGWH